jgi:hypothetical protein
MAIGLSTTGLSQTHGSARIIALEPLSRLTHTKARVEGNNPYTTLKHTFSGIGHVGYSYVDRRGPSWVGSSQHSTSL